MDCTHWQSEHGIRPDELEEVMVGLPEPGWKIIGDPETAKQAPKRKPFSCPAKDAQWRKAGFIRS